MQNSKLDKELQKNGDSRNVVDKYRFWKNSAIKSDMQKNARDFEVAVENLERDFNIGSIIRTSNAFGVKAFHTVGRKSINRRGAMVTDKYINMNHFSTAEEFANYANKNGASIIGVDILEGVSKPIEDFAFPKNSILFFGSESDGLSKSAQSICKEIVHISQFGSTRSINVGAAAAVAMYALSLQLK
ncbi:MAG: RNA methyltransferase [Bifidobacteriaceae bacterium]|nr:RNA methyltransferase [Bifidobacteriaceae bacterium]